MRFNRITSAGLLATVMGVVGGLVPLTAQAVTPPSAAFQVAGTSTCMEASGFTSGSTVVLDNCNGLINQKFYINRAGYAPNGQIAYTLETAKAASYQCVNNANHSSMAGAPVNLDRCNGINSAERFVMNGNQLQNILSGECLDSSVVGAQLLLNPCDPNAAGQQFVQVPNNAQP